jgi:hypothetical protein
MSSRNRKPIYVVPKDLDEGTQKLVDGYFEKKTKQTRPSLIDLTQPDGRASNSVRVDVSNQSEDDNDDANDKTDYGVLRRKVHRVRENASIKKKKDLLQRLGVNPSGKTASKNVRASASSSPGDERTWTDNNGDTYEVRNFGELSKLQQRDQSDRYDSGAIMEGLQEDNTMEMNKIDRLSKQVMDDMMKAGNINGTLRTYASSGNIKHFLNLDTYYVYKDKQLNLSVVDKKLSGGRGLIGIAAASSRYFFVSEIIEHKNIAARIQWGQKGNNGLSALEEVIVKLCNLFELRQHGEDYTLDAAKQFVLQDELLGEIFAKVAEAEPSELSHVMPDGHTILTYCLQRRCYFVVNRLLDLVNAAKGKAEEAAKEDEKNEDEKNEDEISECFFAEATVAPRSPLQFALNGVPDITLRKEYSHTLKFLLKRYTVDKPKEYHFKEEDGVNLSPFTVIGEIIKGSYFTIRSMQSNVNNPLKEIVQLSLGHRSTGKGTMKALFSENNELREAVPWDNLLFFNMASKFGLENTLFKRLLSKAVLQAVRMGNYPFLLCVYKKTLNSFKLDNRKEIIGALPKSDMATGSRVHEERAAIAEQTKLAVDMFFARDAMLQTSKEIEQNRRQLLDQVSTKSVKDRIRYAQNTDDLPTFDKNTQTINVHLSEKEGYNPFRAVDKENESDIQHVNTLNRSVLYFMQAVIQTQTDNNARANLTATILKIFSDKTKSMNDELSELNKTRQSKSQEFQTMIKIAKTVIDSFTSANFKTNPLLLLYETELKRQLSIFSQHNTSHVVWKTGKQFNLSLDLVDDKDLDQEQRGVTTRSKTKRILQQSIPRSTMALRSSDANGGSVDSSF